MKDKTTGRRRPAHQGAAGKESFPERTSAVFQGEPLHARAEKAQVRQWNRGAGGKTTSWKHVVYI